MATSGYIKKTADFGYVQFEWALEAGSQSVEDNKSTIKYKLWVQRNSGEFSSSDARSYSIVIDGKTIKSGTISLLGYGTKTVCSGTTTIKHNSDGSKTFAFSFSQEIGLGYGTITGSGTAELPTINRKSTLAVSNGTLGVAQTLTITRQSTEFKHRIQYTCGSVVANILLETRDDGTNKISFTPPLSLASQNTTGTTVSIVYTITTYNGNETVGSNTYTVNAGIPSDIKPSCTMSCYDEEGLETRFGWYINGYSKLNVEITPTIAYGSEIAQYIAQFTDGAIRHEQSFTRNIIAMDSDVLNSGVLGLQTIVKDSRGRLSESAFTNLSILDYKKPQITSLKVKRCNANGAENINGEYAKVTFSASVSSIPYKSGTGEQNTSNFVLEYKKASESQYTSIDVSALNGSLEVNENSYIFVADSGSTYDIQIIVTDEITSASRTAKVSTGEVLMHWHSSGKAMGIGKVAEIQGVLDIGFLTRFYGGIQPIWLEHGTDLDTIHTPGFYVGQEMSVNSGFSNKPVTLGSNQWFFLNVEGYPTGEIKQIFTVYDREKAKTYERFYSRYASGVLGTYGFGEWFCTSDFEGGSLLWQGVWLGHSTGTIALAEKVSKQRNGLVFVFSTYDMNSYTHNDENWHSFFIPKKLVALHGGHTHSFMMCDLGGDKFAKKTFYIADDSFAGHANNNQSFTSESGISYQNAWFCLRYIIGV